MVEDTEDHPSSSGMRQLEDGTRVKWIHMFAGIHSMVIADKRGRDSRTIAIRELEQKLYQQPPQ